MSNALVNIRIWSSEGLFPERIPTSLPFYPRVGDTLILKNYEKENLAKKMMDYPHLFPSVKHPTEEGFLAFLNHACSVREVNINTEVFDVEIVLSPICHSNVSVIYYLQKLLNL